MMARAAASLAAAAALRASWSTFRDLGDNISRLEGCRGVCLCVPYYSFIFIFEGALSLKLRTVEVVVFSSVSRFELCLLLHLVIWCTK